MYLSDFLKVLGRRWYLVLLGVLLTVVGSVGIFRLISPTYEVDTNVLVVGPSVTGDKNLPTNAYLHLDAGLKPIRDVTTQVLMDPRSQGRLLAGAPTATYTVAATPLVAAPMISIVVKSKDSNEAAALSDNLVQSLGQTLSLLQTEVNAPTQLMVTSKVVSQTAPYPLTGNRLRAALAVGLLGIAISLMLPFLAESASRRRNRPSRDFDYAPSDLGKEPVDDRAGASH